MSFRIICQKKPKKFPFQMSKIEKNKAMQKHTKKKDENWRNTIAPDVIILQKNTTKTPSLLNSMCKTIFQWEIYQKS